MTRKSSCHLLDMLAEVPDPRNNKGKRHPLVSILALVVIGLMCGHNGYTSIATWARSQPALAKALGFTHKVSDKTNEIARHLCYTLRPKRNLLFMAFPQISLDKSVI